MIDVDDAEAALSPVRELIEADGGKVELVGTGADSIHIRLVLDTAECAECVMPKAFLQTVALDMLAGELPGLTAVEIDDPRE
ncbi:MAG: NifU family protein [Actinomycetota bacterium]